MTLSRSGQLQRIGKDIFLYNDKPNRSEELRDANAQSAQGNVPYSQQQRMNSSMRPGNGKQAAINPAKFPQGNAQRNKTPPTTSASFNPYQSKQNQQTSSPVAASTTTESPRGGFNRNGRGDRGGKRGGRGRDGRGFRDRDQPERASPVPMPDRSLDFPDADAPITPMKREFEDTNLPPRQRSRMNYDKA